MSFIFCFDREDDIYQFSYCFPYTYTKLQNYLDSIEKKYPEIFTRELLCLTVVSCFSLYIHMFHEIILFKVLEDKCFLFDCDIYIRIPAFTKFTLSLILNFTMRFYQNHGSNIFLLSINLYKTLKNKLIVAIPNKICDELDQTIMID